MSRERDERRRRRTFLLPLVKLPMYQALISIDGMGPRQLRALLRAIDSCSGTNCWWAEYRCGRLLRPYVVRALSQ